LEETPAKPEEIIQSLSPVLTNLTTVYRLSTNIINVLKNVFKDLFNAKVFAGKINTNIEVYRFTDEKEEIEYCWNSVIDAHKVKITSNIAILLYSHKSIVKFINQVLQLNNKPIWNEEIVGAKPNYELLNKHLEDNKIPIMYMGNSFGSLERADKEGKIILMTYHSAKGLDFDYVYLPIVGDGMWLHKDVPLDALLLVALSRSKNELIISYTSNLFWGFKKFIGNLPYKDMPEEVSEEDDILF
jgi:superfamily I DNA/RNA helicase